MAMKKKAVLTLEDRLQATLVPDWEQPYKLPKNWCWTHLGSLVSVSKEKTDDFTDESVKYIGLEHLKKGGGIIGYSPATEVKSQKSVFHTGQILYGKLRPYLNKHDIAAFSGVCSTDILVFDTTKCTTNNFVNLFLGQRDFVSYATKNSRGINLPRVSENLILNTPCPLPPLTEQQRIVDRIESLFSKLDEAREKMEVVFNSFEARKAAILHKAFTGELTVQWRKTNSVGMNSWKRKLLKNVAQIGSGGTPSRTQPAYYDGIIPWVKTGELCWEDIYETEESISDDGLSNSTAKLYPAGTVLVAMYGQGLTRGRAGILRVAAATNQAVCALQPIGTLTAEFLFYYFMNNYWDYRELAFGGNQPNYSATMIGNWSIDIPTYTEQAEIVRILNELLNNEFQVHNVAEAVLDQIDLIKQSILARAFRSELGTNDPNEESAVELLKQII